MKSRPGGSQRLPPGPGASLRLRASSNPLFPASRAHRLLHIILLLFLLCFLSSLTQALSSLIYVGNMYLSVKSQPSRCESAFHLSVATRVQLALSAASLQGQGQQSVRWGPGAVSLTWSESHLSHCASQTVLAISSFSPGLGFFTYKVEIIIMMAISRVP